jgi:two-component sensor histidine kinase
VKNTLATVQAVAGQTLRNAQDLEQARHGLTARLLALARGHDVLTRESWGGADLADIVASAVAAGDRRRFHIEGPHARLSPKSVLALSMSLHELFTNAAKYGALSTDAGTVAITWTRDGDNLTVVWRESGGPPVAAPRRRGFGSRMIDALARDLNGVARLDFRPEGLVCTIEAHLRANQPEDADAALA